MGRPRHRPIHSDADIGVGFAGGLPPAGRERGITYARLCLELSDLLDPFRVDLVFLQENHSVFQAEAIKGHCLYCCRPEVRERYEEMILRRAADFRPFLLAYLKEALEGQAMIDTIRVLHRLELVTGYLRRLRAVAGLTREAFLADPLAMGAAEIYLRRSLEAIFDVGRHILTKTGHVDMAEEYKAIARGLVHHGVVSQANAQPLLEMAGYRNRMVRFYHEITAAALMIWYDGLTLQR